MPASSEPGLDDLPSTPIRIGVLGAGSLGAALLTGFAAAAQEGRLALRATTKRRTPALPNVGITTLATHPEANDDLAAWADVLFIAVSPESTQSVVEAVGPRCRPGSIVVPVAIGVTASDLARRLPAGVHLVRAMPNLPVRSRAGVSGVSSEGTASEPVERIEALLRFLGTVVRVDDDRLDTLSVVSGAGPAHVAYLVSEWTAAAASLELPASLVSTIVVDTFRGTLTDLVATATAPDVLIAGMSTPGSATRQAMVELEQAGFRGVARRAMRAAEARAAELRGTAFDSGGGST